MRAPILARLHIRHTLLATAICLAAAIPVQADSASGTFAAPSLELSPQSAPAEEAAPPPPQSIVSEDATFLLSHDLAHGEPEVLWPGFLSGLRGFEHFYEPLGNPLYFESPFNSTQLRLLYLHHDFPNRSQIGGGDLNVYAAQIRLALTERLAFIATKDGYSDLNAGILPPEEGWNDFAIGVKYVFVADRDNDFALTGGVRWEWENGDQEVLQGDAQELSPFVSVAKGFDRLHLLGNVTGRLPMDGDRGNYVLQWDLHADYEIAPETLPGFAPAFEVHGLHYLSDADHLPLSVGGLDYTNLGSTDVGGNTVISGGPGFRWKLSPHASLGAIWEFAFTDRQNDIMGNRVTVDFILSW